MRKKKKKKNKGWVVSATFTRCKAQIEIVFSLPTTKLLSILAPSFGGFVNLRL